MFLLVVQSTDEKKEEEEKKKMVPCDEEDIDHRLGAHIRRGKKNKEVDGGGGLAFACWGLGCGESR